MTATGLVLPRVGIVRRFPVTVILALQYVPLVLVQAQLHQTRHIDFLYGIVGLALAASFAAEFAVNPLRKPLSDISRERPVFTKRASVILMIGAAAVVLSAVLGQGSFAVQVGLAERSPLVPFLTPFQPWLIVGSAYFLAARQQGLISNRRLLAILGCAATAQLYASLVQAITQPFLSYVVTIGVVALLIGAVRLRAVLVGALILFLAFPAIGAIRNQARSSLGASQFESQQFSFQSRLREDLYLSDARQLPTDHEYGEMSLGQTLRVGLVPSALDSGRPQVASGGIISRALGRSGQSSSTLTTAGSLWVFVGAYGLVAYFAGVAILVFLLMRRLTPARLTLLALAVYSLLLIERTYPESFAGFLQGTVSAGAAMLFMRRREPVEGTRPTTRRRRAIR